MRPLRLLLAVLALSGCASNLPPPTVSSGLPPTRELAPLRFTVKRYPGGEPYAVDSDRGHVVLLDVWATWCEPCRDALPMYEQLARRYGARGLKVYALNVDEDTRAIPAFLADTKVTDVSVLLDTNAEVADKVLKVRAMPTTVLIDRQGRVRSMHVGFSEESLAKYQEEIEELLAEPMRK